MAFELHDIIPRNHLFVPRKPRWGPPWSICKDIAIISLLSSHSNSILYLVYDLKVYYDIDNIKNSEKQLEVTWVVKNDSSHYDIARDELFTMKNMNIVYTLIWNNVCLLVDKSLFQKLEVIEKPPLLQWKAPTISSGVYKPSWLIAIPILIEATWQSL